MEEVQRRALRQHGVLSRGQLVEELEVDDRAIERFVAASRLHRIHRGVLSIVHARLLSREGRWLAAVLACGEDAVLSGLAAAAHHGFRRTHDRVVIEVSVPTQNGRKAPKGVFLHRVESLMREHTETRNAIPITTVERAFLDIARRHARPELLRLVREAEYRKLTDVAKLHAFLEAVVGAPRADKRALNAAIAAYVTADGITDSVIEDLFLAICTRYDIPLPRVQRHKDRMRLDFLWPAYRLVVETDGYDAHRGAVAATQDRARDRELALTHGLLVLRFTWAEIVHAPEQVAADVRRAIEQRAAAATG